MPRIHPVIMCGGSGTRLWPVSRQAQPKQFQSFTSEHTLFQETVLRVDPSAENLDFEPPVIIGSTAYLDLMEDQLSALDITPNAILLEPCPRNTAAVAAIAALQVIAQTSSDDLVLLMPSDHHITHPAKFHEAVCHASKAAIDGWITTFGIIPNGPETGYGYIQDGEQLYSGCKKVQAFHEKPTIERAKAYLAEGGFTWNAGIFLYSPARMLEELSHYAPDVLTTCREALANGQRDDLVTQLEPGAFANCPSISIDYAVMERTEHAAICGPVDCGWSDIGSWQALRDLTAGTPPNDTISIDSDNCYVHSDGETIVATLGVKDLIIVVHEGAVLVAHADKSQDIGAIVQELKDRDQKDKL